MTNEVKKGKEVLRRVVRRALRWCGVVIGGVLLLIILLAAALYIPAVQAFAVKQVMRIASEQTGMTIGVERVRLAFPIDLSVYGVLVAAPDTTDAARQDTIASVDEVVVGVALLPLLKGRVDVDGLTISGLRFATGGLIASAAIRGSAERLSLASHGINLLTSEVDIDDVALSGIRADIQLPDTVPEDTTGQENTWRIRIGSLSVSDADVSLHMPGEGLVLRANGGNVSVEGGALDLGAGVYKVADLDLGINELDYDATDAPYTAGAIDVNHISLSGVKLAADSISYSDAGAKARITKGVFAERNGLQLTRLTGIVETDSAALYVRNVVLNTAYSSLQADGMMSFSAFDATNPGRVSLSARAELGRGDVLPFLSGMPEAFVKAYPYQSLAVKAEASGTVRDLELHSLSIEMPTVFAASLSGGACNLLDMNSLHADVDISLKTFNTGFLTSAFLTPDMQEMINIPPGTTLSGNITVDGDTYGADLTLAEGGGTINLNASCTIPDFNFKTYADITYAASVAASSFPVNHFVKGINTSPLSLVLRADGSGGDIFESRTRLCAGAEITSLNVEGYDLDGTTAEAKIENGVAGLTLNCVNDIIRGTVAFDALLAADDLKGTLACTIDNADLRRLGVCDVALNTSLCAHVDVESDLASSHLIRGYVGDIYLKDSATLYRARDLAVDAFTRPDTTLLHLDSGDLSLLLSAQGGYEKLAALGTTLSNELLRQAERKYISQDTLLKLLPLAQFTLHSGQSNFLYGYMKRAGYAFKEINADISLSPETGINGAAEIDSLCASGMQIDTIRFTQQTSNDIFSYTFQARNGADNPQYAFNLILDGSLFATGSNLRLRLYDRRDSLGVDLALLASLEHGGIRVSLTDEAAILGYTTFALNDGNYLFMGDNGRISADLRLRAADGTGLQIFSDNANKEALQDMTLEINQLDLAPILDVIPYCPKITGTMNGDFHVIETETEFSLSSSIGVDSLVYEGIEMGNLASEFVYMPLKDGGHSLN
ncbi:MAG: AsmA family protein, partial [Prevotella sp.]|nr:AsmA family protein [Prevotella sp.]